MLTLESCDWMSDHIGRKCRSLSSHKFEIIANQIAWKSEYSYLQTKTD